MPLDSTTETELRALVADFKTAGDEVRRLAEKHATEMKNLGAVTEETKTAADKALSEMNALGLRLTDVEQKMVKMFGGRGPDQQVLKSLGQHVVENEQVKALMASKSGQARISIDVEVRDLLSGPSTWGPGVSPSSSLVIADRQPIVQPPMRTLVVRDLLMPGSTTSNAIEYPVETDNPAATGASVVSEAAIKPQTNLTFDLRSVPVRTIAHFTKASRQILDDAPQLQTYVDGRLRYGLGFVEENEFLFGDGTGQHIFGITPQASAYSQAFSAANMTNIDVLREAALQATLAFFPATGYVLHPTDWAKIELTKDTQGRYIIGQPQGLLTPTLWNLPVVQTPAMLIAHFLAGSFRLGAQIFDRMGIEVLISTEDVDNFQRNMVTIRAEERLALAVYRPAAFIYGTLPF